MSHIVFIICILLAMPTKREKKMNFFWLSFVVLCIFSALRYGFGSDYFSYKKIYDSIHGYGNTALGEYYQKQTLFFWLNKISPSFYFFVGVTSIFFVGVICIFIYKNCSQTYQWMAVAIFLLNPYLFLINLSAIRQCLAMVLFMIAVEFAYKKKFLIYAILIFVASLFHTSAIILLPFYLIINDKPVENASIIIIIGATAFILLAPNFIQKLIEFVIDKVFDDTTYNLYLSGSNSLRATILSSLYFFYVLLNIKHLSGKKLVYAKLYLCGTIFCILAYRVAMLTRMQMYFDIFSIIIVPYLVDMNKTEKLYTNDNFGKKLYLLLNKYLIPCLLFVIYLLRYYSFFVNPLWESFRVYKTIFSVF